MSDLIDLYNKGTFSKEEENQGGNEDTPKVEATPKEETVSVSKALIDIEIGRNFFNQYLDLLLNRRRLDPSNDFRMDDLYPNNESEEVTRRKEREDKFIANRQKDFIKYVNILESFVKTLDDKNEQSE